MLRRSNRKRRATSRASGIAKRVATELTVTQSGNGKVPQAVSPANSSARMPAPMLQSTAPTCLPMPTSSSTEMPANPVAAASIEEAMIDMTSELDTKLLYKSLCCYIGSEKAVKTRRWYYVTHDFLGSTKSHTPFTCGSKGEGMDMTGSDFDMIVFRHDIRITEKRPEGDISPGTFLINTTDTSPGFARLQLCSQYTHTDMWCEKLNDNYFLSSKKVRQITLRLNRDNNSCVAEIEHGPCMSTKNKTHDVTTGFICRSFINKANEWTTRERRWPTADTRDNIIKRGVIFVPIGRKDSETEDIEWRISFSVAEKLLVFSFTHTQFLTYALLKIMLKEHIEKDERFKGLLCSYFLKTVVFWVSETLSSDDWIPENIEKRFFDCFKKLVTFVEQNNLPHYFIHENNMLTNRINLGNWEIFKKCLSSMYDKSLKSIFGKYIKSNLYDDLTDDIILLNEVRYMILCGQPILTNLLTTECFKKNSMWLLKQQHDQFISKRLIFSRSMSTVCCSYQKYKEEGIDYDRKFVPFIRLTVNTDAVSGFNVLATYYYCVGRYCKALIILNQVLDGFQNETHDKLYYTEDKFTIDHLLKRSEGVNLSETYRKNTIEPNDFFAGSFLIPEEMRPEVDYKGFVQKPPLVYSKFLRFLCYYRLNLLDCTNEKTRREQNTALSSLNSSIDGKYIGNHVMKA